MPVKQDTKKTLMDTYVYVPLGAAKLLADKTKEFSGMAMGLARSQRETVAKGYQDLAERGQKLASSIQRSVYTKRAVEQSKTARTQVKAAATSVRKAAGSTTKATKAAAKKVG
jgi:hypothetical protein